MSAPLRFKDGGYINWVKCSLALNIMKEGLHNYVDTEVKKLHLHIKQRVTSTTGGPSYGKTCGSCTSKDVRKARGNPIPWQINCRSNVCNRWLSEILIVHTEPHNPGIYWKNADISQWPTNPYEIAKVYMPKGQDRTHNLPQGLDASAILSLLKYCTWFSKSIPNIQLLSDLIDIRNEVFHSGELRVSDSNKDGWIDKMIQLLSDLNIGTAQSELSKVKSEDIDVSFRENEIRALQNLVSNLVSVLVEVREEVSLLRNVQFRQSEETDKDLEEMKKSLQEFEKISDKMVSFLDKNPDIDNTEIIRNIRNIDEDVDDLQSKLCKVEEELSCIKERVSSLENQQEKHQEELDFVGRRLTVIEDMTENNDQLIQQKEIDIMREDLKSFYKTLSTISIAPLDEEETVPLEEFFTDIIIEDQTEGKKQQLFSYKQIFSNKKNQRIILTGLSGSGKSTFCKKIVYAWCKKEPNKLIDTEMSDTSIPENPKATTDKEVDLPIPESHETITIKDNELSDSSILDSSGAIAHENILSQFSLLFYIYVPKISSEKKLTEVLYNQCLKRKSDQLSKILQEQPEKMLIILDGMDEMRDNIPPFLSDLLGRILYPRIIVLMAMRSWRISKLQLKPLSHYDLLLEIQGLSEINASKFVKKVINLNKKHIVMKRLCPSEEEEVVFSSFRNVPLLLLFLAHIWCQDQCLPTRRQDLYKQILDCLIKRCLSKTGNKYTPALTDQNDMNMQNKMFQELYLDSACKAAYHFLLQGVSGSSVVISDKDLMNKLGSDAQFKLSALLDCGILSKLDAFSTLEKKVSITFLHLSIHEYLTARHLVNNEDAFQNFLISLETLNDVLRYENLFIFISGLNAKKGHMAFIRICQVCDEDTIVKQYRQGKDMQILSSVENLNQMYKACLNEMDSQELVEISDLIFPSLDERPKLMMYRLSSSFVKSLYFNIKLDDEVLDLRSLTNLTSLKFCKVTMSEECSRSLCESISGCIQLERLELQGITLHNSVLDLSSLTNLTFFTLGDVTMSEECIRSLCCSIIGCTHLERLELMDIMLHDDVLDFTSLTNLISLKLRNVTMSEEYSRSMCSSINGCTHLERLKLKWIKLHDGVFDLKSLTELTSLTIWHVTMSEECSRSFCNSINSCTHLKRLYLRGITLYDSVLDLRSVTNLTLIDVTMSEEYCRILCSSISSCTHLESLELQDITLLDGVIDLRSLTKLTALSLWHVTMSEKLSRSLYSSISGCSHLKSLKLVVIKLHDSVVDLNSLTNLTFLKLDGVTISEECSSHLCNSVSACTHLERMQLERIKLHDGVLDLSRLTNLTFLKLYNVTMSEECSRSICCSIAGCTHLKELQLRGSFDGVSLELYGGILDFKKLTNLTSLTLDDVIMSKECSKSLSSSISDCTHLEELQLIDITLHDGVLDLRSLSDLRKVKLSGVIMSAYCKQTLKVSLKHCQKLQLCDI